MKTLIKDDQGSVSFFVLVLSIALLAMMGLVMDTGRGFTAHTQVQAYVDNVALAMARELDGEPGAINRAKAIMNAAGPISSAAVNKSSTLTTDFGASSVDTFDTFDPIFLTAQPQIQGPTLDESDYQHLITTSDADASHVLVIGKQEEVPWTFLNLTALGETGGEFDVQAWAAAELVDDIVQTNERLMVCGGPAFTGLNGGEQIKLTKSRNGAWQEGNYGVVATIQDDAAGTCSAYASGSSAEVACLLGIDNPTPYEHSKTVSALGDQTNADGTDSQSFHAGLNTSFGIYDDLLSGLQESQNVSPDKNTITGDLYTCSGVDYNTVTTSAALPTDQCFIDGTCTIVSSGVTQEMLDEYCERNHGGACPTDADGNPVTSRYQLYLAEIANDLLDPTGVETTNTCNTTAANKANRRVVEVAIADCSGIAADTVNPTNVPVVAYAQLFLTQPVNSSNYYVANFDSFDTPDGTTIQMQEGDVISTDSEYDGEGYTVYDPYISVGLTITAVNGRDAEGGGDPGNSNHAPMLFNTNWYSGGDSDLAHTGRGNVLILSENDDDRDRAERNDNHNNGPDDDAQGGTIIFRFDEPTYVHSLVVYDTEGGGAIRVYDELLTDDEIADLYLDDGSERDLDSGEVIVLPDQNAIEEGNGLSQEQTDKLAGAFWATGAPAMHDHETTTVNVQQIGVRMLVYTFEDDSGALDGIVFSNTKTDYQQRDEITAEFIDYIEDGDGQMMLTTQLSN
ncbi:MAG: pilus assembly protein TadG-related protein [Pseudomonadota bacterium]